MVEIEHAHDHLKSLEKSGWKTLAEQLDLDPAHEALLLREQFTELLRTDDARGQPIRFRELLADGEALAQALERSFREHPGTDLTPESSILLSAQFQRFSNTCLACHREFRDVPLSEKENPKH